MAEEDGKEYPVRPEDLVFTDEDAVERLILRELVAMRAETHKRAPENVEEANYDHGQHQFYQGAETALEQLLYRYRDMEKETTLPEDSWAVFLHPDDKIELVFPDKNDEGDLTPTQMVFAAFTMRVIDPGFMMDMVRWLEDRQGDQEKETGTGG